MPFITTITMGTFTDVTEKAGVGGGTFGMGANAGDYDNDGWQDLYVTAYGHKHSLSQQRQTERSVMFTDKAGVAAPGWSTCAVWFDYDKDGKLDLFASSFVDYNKNTSCGNNKLGKIYYCIPRVFKRDQVISTHNMAMALLLMSVIHTGISKSPGKSFVSFATDVNNDGWPDLFVANDTMPNFLFINKGNGKFEEVGLQSGVAFSDNGSPRSGMGVDATDYDGDGWPGSFCCEYRPRAV
jgi:hypothetical protein